ncbi:MAG: sugar phosphate isomerase/epimerase [Oscillospiraceae bacterium]|nr:sugar phosphate isomerase/epimerase [Oscillospiraceae bacterium]
MSEIKLYAFADEACKQVDGQIAAMLRNGLNGLEIRGVDGVNVSAISVEKAKEVRKKLDDNGLVAWSMGSRIGKIHMDQDFNEHLDVLRHTLELANILGAKNLRMFSFFMPAEELDANRQEVMDRLGKFLEIAKGTGVALCHENEKGIYGATADRCLDIFKTHPDLKGVFDPANFVQCGEDTLRAWDLLNPYIYYLHIKDALSDSRVVPSGKGEGNVAAIVKAYLAKGGRDMTIEPHLKLFDGLKALEEDGNTSAVGNFTYATTDEAFDVACNALKDILATM